MENSLLAFIAVAFMIGISPGQTNLLVLSKGMTGRNSEVLAVLAGIFFGNITWIALSSIGVATIIDNSHVGFQILKFCGATYLIYLGYKAFSQANASIQLECSPSRKSFFQGAISSLSNPKGLIFYAAFLPQFVNSQSNATTQLLVLGVLYLSVFLPIAMCYGIFGVKLISYLKSQVLIKRIKQISGGILASMGIAILFSKDA